jgi:hypothetical protein
VLGNIRNIRKRKDSLSPFTPLYSEGVFWLWTLEFSIKKCQPHIHHLSAERLSTKVEVQSTNLS